ncbi:MAG TPA: DUF4190 domain-containing protein [Armatimonadota bacterium]|jgi:prepilin-type processing-associated H-X9-DG protein
MTGGTFENPGGAPPPPRKNGLAIASVVLGALGVVTCGISAVAGLVMGIVASGQIRGSNGRQTGKSTATAGIIVSAISLFLIVPLTLAAILFPVFAKAREQAQQSVCLNNVRQLSIATQAYAQDYNDTFPPARQWDARLQPAVRSNTVWDCPKLGPGRGGYGYNAAVAGREASRMQNPAAVVLEFEARGGGRPYGGRELADPRHLGRCSTGFIDGHVQALNAEELDGSGIQWTPALVP